MTTSTRPSTSIPRSTGGSSRAPSPFWAVAVAILKGFVRDRAAVFFALVFPLMFLVLFGGVFNFDGSSRIDVIQVGDVTLVDALPPGCAARPSTTRSRSAPPTTSTRRSPRSARATPTRRSRCRATPLVAHYTQTDQVKAAVTQGTLRAFVDGANVAASGQPPRYAFRAAQVEDESLEAIQFVTPGLLGWAIAMSASFGAAATLQGWRQSKLLRRLQLSPVPARTIVARRGCWSPWWSPWCR